VSKRCPFAIKPFSAYKEGRSGQQPSFQKPMTIEVAVLCDAATDDNGKLNLLGAFNLIATQQLPAMRPACAIALRITFAQAEEGAHRVRFNFVDADGKPIMPNVMEIAFNVTMPPDLHFCTRNFIVNFQQLQLPAAGLYSVDILVDDRSQASIPLLVKYTPPPSIPPSP